MKNILFLNLVIVFFLTTSNNSQTVSSNPTRPSASDNAFITEYGYIEIETGFAAQKYLWSVPSLLKFTLIKNGEFGLIMNGILNGVTTNGKTETKIGDPGLQFKYQFINSGIAALAIVGRSEFIHKDTKLTGYVVPSFTTHLGQIDATAGISKINTTTSVFYAIAFSPRIDMPLGFFVELFGEKIEDYSPLYFDAGISYPITTDFVVDAAVVRGLNKEATDLQYHIGITKTLFKIF